MPDPFEKLAAFSKQIERNTAPGGPMDLLGQFFGQARAAMLNTLLAKKAASQLIPDVRKFLRNAWKRSNLDPDSNTGNGRLYRAAVEESEITITELGINIKLAEPHIPKGSSKYQRKAIRDQFFAWAATMRYGAVHGPRENREIRDTITGSINRIKKTSVLGWRAKQSIKKAHYKNQPLSKRSKNAIERENVYHRGIKNVEHTARKGVSVNSVSVTKAYDFWKFSPDEIDILENKYHELYINEINQYLDAYTKALERKQK